MRDFSGVILGGRVRLSSKGYWMDDEKQVWINEGRLLTTDHLVKVCMFDPKLDSQDVESRLLALEKRLRQKSTYSSAQEINHSIFSYAIFDMSKPVQEQVTGRPEKAVSTTNQGKPNQKSKGARVPTWVFISVFGIAIVAVCTVAGILGGPTIMAMLQPPTSTSTLTPTSTNAPTATVTLLPTLTPSKVPVIFVDDFSDLEKTETQWIQVSGTWDSTQGVYTCQKQENPCLSLENSEITSNFVVSVDMRGDSATDKAIYLGYTENQKDIQILLQSDTINQIKVIKHVVGQDDVVLAQVAFDFGNNNWYRLNITAIEKSLKIMVNEKQVLELAIETQSDLHGKIGLGIPSNSSNGTTASFDNFVIDLPKSLTPTPTLTLTPSP